ncbi:MAG: glycosyltransferase family 4 protein [Bacteroidales bacterium]|nr:glycosyltransferase family 4 protein [Bacteroidales bacterium]
MDILFFSLGSAKSSLYGGLAKYCSEKGHTVTMISPSRDGFSDNMVDGVRCITFKALPLSGGSSLRKGVANLLLPFQSRRVFKRFFNHKNVDLVLSSTPPVSFYLPIEYIRKQNPQAKHYLILRDIWPEAFNLFDFEKHHPLIYAFFRKQEKRLYAASDIIGCMSEGNIDFVANSNPEVKDKLRLLYNWNSNFELKPSTVDVRKKYALEEKFVLIYGGNMGVPQGLDNVVCLAELIREKKDVVFLLIGKGTDKERIKKTVTEKHLSNVIIMDFLPKEDYDAILQTCDVGLISLNDRLKTPSIPSKTIGYWKLRMPILAIIDHVTDYGQNIIDKSQSGVWAYSGDTTAIIQSFEKLYSDATLRKQMGENGYNFFLKECTVEKAYNTIISQLYE